MFIGVPSGGRTLQILKAKVSDGGQYSCVAVSAAGEARKNLHLAVLGESRLHNVCVPHPERHAGRRSDRRPLAPRPFSSSEPPGRRRRRGLPRGGERARRRIGDSGVRVRRRAAAHRHLVQERPRGDGVGEAAHPGGATDARDLRLGGQRRVDAMVWMQCVDAMCVDLMCVDAMCGCNVWMQCV